MLKFALPFALLAAPLSVHAQTTNDLAGQRMLAEHQQWIADHQVWHDQHLDMATRLEAAAVALRSEDLDFAESARQLEAHGKALLAARTAEQRGKLVAEHVRSAAEHMQAAQAHHEILDEVTRLEALLVDDRATQMAEEPG